MEATPSFDDVPDFGNSASTIKPGDTAYANGYQYQEMLPAEHQNWFLRHFSRNGNLEQGAISSVMTELTSLLTAAGITPNGEDIFQILNAIKTIAPYCLTLTNFNDTAILGSLIAGKMYNFKAAAGAAGAPVSDVATYGLLFMSPTHTSGATSCTYICFTEGKLAVAGGAPWISSYTNGIFVSWKTLWTAGNDGVDSGADTDLVRGITPGTGGLLLLALTVLGDNWRTALSGNAQSGSDNGIDSKTVATLSPSQFPNGAINVKAYGAKGDGTTDDTTAIQAALTSNVDVFFPSGNYKISDTLIPSGAGTISGPGKLTQTVSKPFFLCNTQTYNGITFKDLTFQGSFIDAQEGIKFGNVAGNIVGPTRVKVLNCNFYDCGIGVHTGYSKAINNFEGSIISNCVFKHCMYGVYCDVYGEYVLVSSNTFNACTLGGLYIAAGNIDVFGNNISDCVNGIQVYGATGTNDSHGTIMANMINHISNIGILLSGLTVGSETIIGNKLYAGDSNTCIRIENCSNSSCTVVFNELQGKITGYGNSVPVVKQNNFGTAGQTQDELPGYNCSIWKLETLNGNHRIGLPGSTTVKLGIGRDAVSHPLEVQGTIGAYNNGPVRILALSDVLNGNTHPIVIGQGYLTTTDRIGFLHNEADADLAFVTGTAITECFRIDHTNNYLLIGRTTSIGAGYKLQVEGGGLYVSGNASLCGQFFPRAAVGTLGLTVGSGEIALLPRGVYAYVYTTGTNASPQLHSRFPSGNWVGGPAENNFAGLTLFSDGTNIGIYNSGLASGTFNFLVF